MLFNSFDFLFFFPIVVFIYYLLSHKYRIGWLLLASYFFYFYWEPSLLILLFISTVLDYYCGIKIHESKTRKKKKKYLYVSMFFNLGLLFFFKYFVFFTENTILLLNQFGIEVPNNISTQSYNINDILLPVGISFYTFQTMSYSIDVFRNRIKPERNFFTYALYVSFFPQLVAGPIERASKLIPQFYKKIGINIPNIKKGIIMMAWGLFLKLVVADRIGIYVDKAFLNVDSYQGIPLITGAVFFLFQIYYDFSAYTTIAIGAANILGFDLMQNFNKPIFSTSMSQLWKRWHISLINWLRDYIYMPLARRKISLILAILFVFFLNGLWHGANWTFIIWGILNGLFLIFENATKKHRLTLIKKINITSIRPLFKFFWWLLLFSYITFTLIFFRSPSLNSASKYIENLLVIKNLNINIINNKFELILSFSLIIIVQIIHYFKGNDKIYELVTQRSTPARWIIYCFFIIIMVLFSVNRQNNFIYFQF